jgi:hypothetical protein
MQTYSDAERGEVEEDNARELQQQMEKAALEKLKTEAKELKEAADAAEGERKKAAAEADESLHASSQKAEAAEAEARRLAEELKAARGREEEARSSLRGKEEELAAAAAEAEAKAEAEAEAEGKEPPPKYVVVMSGNPLECDICFQEFGDADAAARHMFWPCQHARPCGDCASRVWKTPAKRRHCPWCKSKIDSRPRPLKPYV